MSEEIKFYGIGGSGKSPVTLPNSSGEQLRSYGIFLPNTSTLSISELDRVDPSLFPWPINAFIPSPNNKSSKPTLIHSQEQLREFIDDTRNPDALINFSLPPQGSNYSSYVGVYAYVGINFIFIHNTTIDHGFLIRSNNSKLFGKVNLENDKVLRILRGFQGWFYDSVFSKDHDFLAPIYKESLLDLKKEENFLLFQAGYRAGFFGESHTHGISQTYIPTHHLGDPYVLGYYVGSKSRNEIMEISGDGVDDKHLILKLKVTLSDEKFQSKLGLLNLHNSIQTGNGFEPLQITQILNPGCKIRDANNTLCGTNGQYCTVNCAELTHMNRSSFSTLLDSACDLIMQAKEKRGEYPSDPLIIPEEITSIKSEVIWSAKGTQFRILSDDADRINYRFQSSSPELQARVTCDNDTFTTIIYKESGRIELDIPVKQEKSGLSNTEFLDYKEAIRKSSFDKPSQYSGSSMMYASLIYNNTGFCLEDGTIVIPNNIFLNFLQKNKGIKINLDTSNLSQEF